MAKAAILGFGVVGSGVAQVLRDSGEVIGKRLHEPLELKYILDVKDFPDNPFGKLVIHDFDVIENDPEVEVVAETIGGTGIALEFTRRALRAGKSVVTSNKELIAVHGCELMTLAQEHRVSYLYEASVGGGIPIIRPMKRCLAANEITEIRGILNGTTNYILTRMIRTGISFREALAEAQANGYAEKDPTADIEGLDACRKICILASLAFGRHIRPEQVLTAGITGVTLADVAYAASRDYRIKLLGRALKGPDGAVRAFVEPHLIPGNDPLSGVEDVFNAIAVKGSAVGDVMFYGRGAGKMPTASAVVADMMEAVAERGRPKFLDWNEGGADAALPSDDVPSRWYVRLRVGLEALRTALGDVTPLANSGAPAGETAVVTTVMTRPELEGRLSGMIPGAVFRVLGD